MAEKKKEQLRVKASYPQKNNFGMLRNLIFISALSGGR